MTISNRLIACFNDEKLFFRMIGVRVSLSYFHFFPYVFYTSDLNLKHTVTNKKIRHLGILPYKTGISN